MDDRVTGSTFQNNMGRNNKMKRQWLTVDFIVALFVRSDASTWLDTSHKEKKTKNISLSITLHQIPHPSVKGKFATRAAVPPQSLIWSHSYQCVFPQAGVRTVAWPFTFKGLLNSSKSADRPRTDRPSQLLFQMWFSMCFSCFAFMHGWDLNNKTTSTTTTKVGTCRRLLCVKGPSLDHVLRRISAHLESVYRREAHLHLTGWESHADCHCLVLANGIPNLRKEPNSAQVLLIAWHK